MATFNIPTSPTKYQQNISSFLGVDFTSAINEIDKRRSPNAFNVINNNGKLEKRPGYKVLAYLGNKADVNGVWNVDTVSGEFFVVHCGTKLYELKTDFSSYMVIKEGLNNIQSTGLIINGKLLILDGKRAIIYDLLKTTDRVSYLDEIGYIPTTQIARKPDGTESQAYEEINLVSDKRMNLFTSDGEATVYQLDETGITVTKVEVLNDSGDWKTVNNYTVDGNNGNITFTATIAPPVIDKSDNVRITYSKVNEDYKKQINKCRIVQAYGYGGNNNRAFLAGNEELQNIISYSAVNDITYFEASNALSIGLETVPITGLLKLNDGTLCAMKNISDSDSTMFYIGWATYNSEEVFNIQGSAKGEGCISSLSSAMLNNEPLIFGCNGVFAINTATINDERYSRHRSYYVDGKLLKEANKGKAVAIAHDGKYYLAINNKVYVADSRIKTTSTYGKNTNYQYEWTLWTNLPVKLWFVWNNKLYFGDTNGNICTFRDEEIGKYKDVDVPVEAYWETPAYELNGIAYNKNLKRVMIASEADNNELTVGYISKSGTKQVLQKVYADSTFPKITTIRKQVKKLSFIQLYVKSENATNMNINGLSFVYTIGNLYKGDSK